jgi:SnoaL-like domain
MSCGVLIPLGLIAQSAPAKSSENRTLEQRVRDIEDREAILKTMYEYAYTIDFGNDVREYTDLYTADAVFQSVASPPRGTVGPVDLASRAEKRSAHGAVVGRRALEAWITNEWQVRDRMLAAGHYRTHEMMEPDITLNGDSATARSYFQTTDNDNGHIFIVSIGVYKDAFVRSRDGRWRIKERLLIRQGRGANSPGAAGVSRVPGPQ